MLLAGNVSICDAKSNKNKQQHSKDYKKFPDGSPEVVLTAFVEADLGDLYNRDNDDRYPLWWNLTERGGIPEDGYLKLYIYSYSITNKSIDKQSGDAIINLVMDVRAIWASGNPTDSNVISWRGVPVNIGNTKYSSQTKQFVEAVFGKTEIANRILNKEIGYYPVPKDKRKWVFPVRMVNKKGKWLIAMESVPLETSYLSSKIDWYKEERNKEIAINDVCNGMRKIDSHSMKPYTDDVKKKNGSNPQKFKDKFCKEDDIKARENNVKEYTDAILQFESLIKD